MRCLEEMEQGRGARGPVRARALGLAAVETDSVAVVEKAGSPAKGAVAGKDKAAGEDKVVLVDNVRVARETVLTVSQKGVSSCLEEMEQGRQDKGP